MLIDSSVRGFTTVHLVYRLSTKIHPCDIYSAIDRRAWRWIEAWNVATAVQMCIKILAEMKALDKRRTKKVLTNDRFEGNNWFTCDRFKKRCIKINIAGGRKIHRGCRYNLVSMYVRSVYFPIFLVINIDFLEQSRTLDVTITWKGPWHFYMVQE